MRVTDPDGVVWQVDRRWLPWRRRMRMASSEVAVSTDGGEEHGTFAGGDFGGGSGERSGSSTSTIDHVDSPVGVIFAALALVLAIPGLVITALVMAEGLLLLLLLPVAVLARIALGRHWFVEVSTGPFEQVWEGDGGSWSQSARLIEQIAGEVREGVRRWEPSSSRIRWPGPAAATYPVHDAPPGAQPAPGSSV